MNTHHSQRCVSDVFESTLAEWCNAYYAAFGYWKMLTPGDGIIIQGIDAVHSERLNFSYANAGYIKLGSSSLITFTDTDNDNQFDIMTMRRYSLNGENNIYFGLTGNKNPYNILLTKSH
ncbi:MAG: hypothetical protein EOM76_11750 [Sphingobacteriia bacterium]|nr:hypothetical protein [Sphingobacteriia bacterium]